MVETSGVREIWGGHHYVGGQEMKIVMPVGGEIHFLGEPTQGKGLRGKVGRSRVWPAVGISSRYLATHPTQSAALGPGAREHSA